jgi:hypothetical protein
MVGALSGAATCTTTYRRVNVAAVPSPQPWHGEPVSSDYHNKNSYCCAILVQISAAGHGPRFRWRPRPIPHCQVGLQGVRGAHAAACEAVFAPLAPWGGLLPLLWLFRGVCDGSSSSARRRPCRQSRFISSLRWSSDVK